MNEIKEQFKNIQSLNNDKLTKLQAEIKMNAATESELYKKVKNTDNFLSTKNQTDSCFGLLPLFTLSGRKA